MNYGRNVPRITQVGNTTVVNAYEKYILDIDIDENRPKRFFEKNWKKVRFSVDISSTILYIVIAVDEQQHIAGMAQEVERLIGNEEVTSSTLVASLKGNPIRISFFLYSVWICGIYWLIFFDGIFLKAKIFTLA